MKRRRFKTYKKAEQEGSVENKKPYNWRKHLKKKSYNSPEYLRAEAAVEKDQIFAELDTWVNRMDSALSELKRHTGEITEVDVMYHLNLISRILKNKYGEETVVM